MSLILGIESSCDETAAAVVRDGYEVLSSAVASQIAKHAAHGGVVPELAAREHLTALNPVLEEALRTAGVTMREVDAVAVTQGPGLIPALLVGLNFAKGLALGYGKPLIAVNHFIAHIYAAFLESGHGVLENPESYPLLALVVSGGHTSLLLIAANGEARQLGCTLDDAAGEALDKAAKLLGLGYPGGPVMEGHGGQLSGGGCGRAGAQDFAGSAGFSGSRDRGFRRSGLQCGLARTLPAADSAGNSPASGRTAALHRQCGDGGRMRLALFPAR